MFTIKAMFSTVFTCLVLQSISGTMLAQDADGSKSQNEIAPQSIKELNTLAKRQSDGQSLGGSYLSIETTERFPDMVEPVKVAPGRSNTWKWATWKSDDFCHPRLLFEERELERHGIFCGTEWKQGVKSGWRFFGRSLVFPKSFMQGKTQQWQLAPGGR